MTIDDFSERDYSTGAKAILSAALDAFAEHGYHGTSVRDIADRVGTSSAALYHHFPSKHDILLTLMRDGIDRLVHESEATVERHDDPVAALAALVRVHVLTHTQGQNGSLVGNTELRSLEPDSRALIVSKRDRQQRLFTDLVTAGVQRGSFTTPYPAEAARAIVTMCTAVANWFRKDGPASPTEIADTYAVLALSVAGYESDGRRIVAALTDDGTDAA